MSAVEMRTEIDGWLDIIQEKDQGLFKAVHALLGTYAQEKSDPILGYEMDGTAVTASSFIEQAEIAVAEAKEGKGISVDELRKRSEEWLNRTP
ncbi:MAG: hypothetical protein AAGJ93_03765 [Bacteroidota bacterium]